MNYCGGGEKCDWDCIYHFTKAPAIMKKQYSLDQPVYCRSDIIGRAFIELTQSKYQLYELMLLMI